MFERNSFPLKSKVLSLAFYFQILSLRGAARVLSEYVRVSKTLFGSELKEKLSIASERKKKHFIAVNEQYWFIQPQTLMKRAHIHEVYHQRKS